MTYENVCIACSYEWESEQRISDDTRPLCPKCGSKSRRLVSGGTGFILNGGGWADQGYSKKGRKNNDDT